MAGWELLPERSCDESLCGVRLLESHERKGDELAADERSSAVGLRRHFLSAHTASSSTRRPPTPPPSSLLLHSPKRVRRMR